MSAILLTVPQLHADWPSVDEPVSEYNLPTPLYDFVTALGEARGATKVAVTQVKSVIRYFISYHGTPWTPGASAGSELTMYVVGDLHDGRWFSLEAGNDYTGWGCRDYAEVRVEADWESIVSAGLTNEMRSALGLSAVTS